MDSETIRVVVQTRRRDPGGGCERTEVCRGWRLVRASTPESGKEGCCFLQGEPAAVTTVRIEQIRSGRILHARGRRLPPPGLQDTGAAGKNGSIGRRESGGRIERIAGQY